MHPLSSYGHQFIFFPQLFYSDPAVNPIMTQLLLTNTILYLYLFLKSRLFLRYFDFWYISIIDCGPKYTSYLLARHQPSPTRSPTQSLPAAPPRPWWFSPPSASLANPFLRSSATSSCPVTMGLADDTSIACQGGAARMRIPPSMELAGGEDNNHATLAGSKRTMIRDSPDGGG